MRIELRFELKERFITADYRGAVMSFFKASLEKNFNEIYQNLYGENRVKNFCFSVFLPAAKFEGGRFNLGDNKIGVKFSSSEKVFLATIFSAMIQSRFMEIPLQGGNSMKLMSVSYSNTRPVTGRAALIKFLSPVLFRVHDKEKNEDKYLDYDAPDFTETADNVARAYLNKIPGVYSEERGVCVPSVSLVPVGARKTVAVSLGRKYNCSFGTFKLDAGCAEALNELYLAGIGSRRSQGFGLFDIISQRGEAQ